MIPKNGDVALQMELRDPRLRAVDPVVDRVSRRILGRAAIITSINEQVDGRREDSYHYEWLAEDLRVNDVPSALAPRFAEELKDALREESGHTFWDVVYKRDRHPDAEIDTSHVHVELDVRRAQAQGHEFDPEPEVDLEGDENPVLNIEEVAVPERVEMIARVAGHDIEIGLKPKIEAATDRMIEKVLGLIPFGWIPVLGPILKERIRKKLDDYLPDGLYEDVLQEVRDQIAERMD